MEELSLRKKLGEYFLGSETNRVLKNYVGFIYEVRVFDGEKQKKYINKLEKEISMNDWIILFTDLALAGFLGEIMHDGVSPATMLPIVLEEAVRVGRFVYLSKRRKDINQELQVWRHYLNKTNSLDKKVDGEE